MILLKGHTDRAVQAHRHVTGATNTYWLNELVRYVKAQGLWDNFRFYPMMPRTNFDTGATVRGMGGLTSNDMTLVNGPTWGASGIAFASASSQYGTIADFLGSETLTVVARVTWPISSAGETLFGQYQTSTNDRAVFVAQNPSFASGNIYALRYPDGNATPREIYESSQNPLGSDNSIVWQWVDGGGRFSWTNKTPETLTQNAGSSGPQTEMYDTSVDILFGAADSSSPSSFINATAHALAFLTGTVTTAQRETITDLINEL